LRVAGKVIDKAVMTITQDAATIERRMHELTEELRSLRPDEVDLDAVERRVQEMANTWGRMQMAVAMKRADSEASEMDIDGQRWGNRRVHGHDYETVFGSVPLERAVYQQSGRGRVAVPMDLRLGLIEGTYTPRLARIATRALASMPEHEAADLLAEVGTATLSNSTIGRLSRAMAARYEQRRPIIAAAVREQHPIPEQAVTVQVGLDGVMVPQDGEHARPRGRKTKSPDPPRHELRYGAVCDPGPAANDGAMGRAWHEASVGTLAFFDADGERLDTIYLARMPEPYKRTLCEELEAELQSVLRERHGLNIVWASDGADAQWQSLKDIESRLPGECTGHRMALVDAFHVAEYVQKAANAIYGPMNTGEADVLAATWRETIKKKGDGASEVVRSMRARLGAVRTRSGRTELRAAIAYIARQNDLGRMRYVEAQRRAYPIGTGITEAAAKTIVGSRMKRAGARFSQHGGQTIMLFRAALLSHRFAALHDELRATYAARVKEAA
jgi:hypothetical protein